ncbi:MAG: serpin family protein [Ruminococcus sp.]|nr:serpin family protein [Ruminococcus sp.]
MIKKIISAVLAISLVMGMCSCSDSSTTETKKNPTASQSASGEPFKPGEDVVSPTAAYQFVPAADISSDEKFLIGANEFSVDLFRNTVMKDLENGKNTLVSPESVLFALGMTSNGAKGDTLKQMQNVLCKDVDTDTFNKNMNKLMTSAQSSSDFKFSIANSVWVKDMQGMTLTEQFARSCKQMYNAEMFKAPFNDETLKQMNNWVNEKTDKMIPKIIDEFGDDTAAVLLNCIAFDAKWEKPYEKKDVVENREFNLQSGKTVNCSMMHSEEKLYVSDDKSQGFIKNYKGGKYAFMAILPNEDVSLSDYVKSMTAQSFAKMYAGKTTQYQVLASVPKFKYDYSAKLNDTLKQMGITDAFDGEKADFSGMTEQQKLFISNVLHKTHIELDEEGTKAAAATAVTMDVSGALPAKEDIKEIRLDRPFAYAIMDTQTGLPVFMGTVCDPTAN